MAAIRMRILPRPHDQANRDKQGRDLNKALLITCFVLPGMLLFLTFALIPILEEIPLSLFKWNGFGPLNNFVGIDNYTSVITNKIFQGAFGHSIAIMLMSVILQLPLALGLALLVGRGDLAGRRLFRGLFFVPYVFSEIVSAIIWLYVFKPDNGLLNMVLPALVPGFKPVALLADRNTVLYAIFAIITWKYFGFHMILYMAGLQSIPKDLEEAARVDGANEFNVLRFITLPLLGSTIRLSVFLSVLGSFQQFVIIWIETEGGPVNSSEVLATFLYKFGIIRVQLGYGSAIAVILFAITLVFSLGYQRIVLRRDYAPGTR